MRSTKLWTAAVAFASISMMASTTTVNSSIPARQCGSYYEPQNYLPESQNENSDYYNLTPTSIDDAVVKQVRDFTDKLDGRWHGTGLDIRCLVTDDTSHTTINSFDVDAEIEKHFQGVLIMEVHQENREQVNLDRIFLSPETELDPSLETDLSTNTHGQKTGHRSYQVDLSRPGTLVYNEKYRRFVPREQANTVNRLDNIRETDGRPSAPFAVRLVHEIKTVSINHSDLTVSRDVYVNGRFFSQQHWELERH